MAIEDAKGGAAPGRSALKGRISRALLDSSLRQSVKKATDKFISGRARAVTDAGDWESMRSRAQAIRSHTIQHLDYYIEQLTARVEAEGGHVHFAATEEDAVDIVRRISRHYDVKTAVKSKSMVSEEIQLNAALQEDGVDVIETDLGEYILQLSKEVPSHIIAPALHKNREQIADLFSNIEGERLSSDTSTLTAYARKKLRGAFLEADMGITGCNFAVAETGHIALVTNEGNGRMVTALPRVQVTLMGMERIVPKLEDLDLMLTMLTRSATGQKSTSYVTVTTIKDEDEQDGPEAFHLVIVDNGRSTILGGEFQEALDCIRCGACLNVCPVYRQMGGHAYGWVYSGPIGAVLTPLYKGIDDWGEVAQASSLCGACDEVCPVKIPIHEMLVGIRTETVKRKKTNLAERLAMRCFGWMMGDARRYKLAQRAASVLSRPLTRNGRITGAPPPLSEWTKTRTLPALPKESFRDIWERELADAKANDDGPKRTERDTSA